MKGKETKQPKQPKPKTPDPMRMNASEFDQMMRHALGAPSLQAEQKTVKKRGQKKA